MRRAVVLSLVIIAVIIIGYLVIRFVVGLLLPFLIAVLLAISVEPVVRFLHRRCRFPRSAAVATALIGVLGGLGTMFAVGMSQLVRELVSLSRDFPLYYNDMLIQASRLMEWLARIQANLPEPVRAALDSQEAQFDELLAGWLKQLVEMVLAGFSALPSLFVVIAVSCIAAFFISRDKQMITRAWWRLVPDRWRPQISTAKNEIISNTFGFIGAQLILVFTTGVLTTLGFLLIGGQYAITMGIVAGILDLVPYVGPAVVICPWAVFSLLRGDVGLAVRLLAILGVVSLVRQYLEVRLIGERMGIHPLVILLSLYVGMRLLGPAGLLIGPLTALVIKATVVSGLLQSIIGSEQEGRKSEKTYRNSWLDGLHRKTDT